MCTAITFQEHYFGRTLDNEVYHPCQVTVTPRNHPFSFRQGQTLTRHHAILGMARVEADYPLYFDAVNERGLAMAGLNFPGNAHYGDPAPGMDNIASFELIPWLLGQCGSVDEAEPLLKRLNLTDTPFRRDLPPTPLHWILADRRRVLVLEPLREGLAVYESPLGVLTNNPPYPQQLDRLNDFLNLTPEEPENRFSPLLDLRPRSRGMGAMGLPGDLSSPSRFVRVAFTKLNALRGETEEETVSQFFHILGTVEMVRGCCRLDDGACELTQYTSCMDLDKGIFYYKTYGNHRITALALNREPLETSTLIRYPLARPEPFHLQNGGHGA